MPEEKKELTFGEEMVGLNFNPSGDDKVGQVKKAFASLIDMVYDKGGHESNESYMSNILRGMAIRSCITAQMAVVKFITWKD